MDDNPDFIIAGVMRGGTTSLHGYLRSHPQISIGSKKEIHFFDNRYDEGLDWYRAQFRRSGAIAVGEATPNYLFDETAMHRIARDLPEARLVISLRDPVARAYSHYWLDHARGTIGVPFEEAVVAELEASTDLTYIARGRYREQMERAYSLFPASQIHVVAFDRLAEEPAETYAEVCRFLGVDDTFRPDELGQANNPYIEFRSLAVRRFSKRLGPRSRSVVGRLNTKPGKYPSMDRLLQRRLEDLYAHANQGLASLVGWTDPPEWAP